MHAKTFDEAIKIVNDNPYGNGSSLFTKSGEAARKYKYEIEAGQVGRKDTCIEHGRSVYCIAFSN